MRKALLLILLLITINLPIDASNTEYGTKLDTVYFSKNTLLTKKISVIGTYEGYSGNSLELKAVILCPYGQTQATKGVFVYLSNSDDSYYASIDYDEIDNIIKSIQFMLETMARISNEFHEDYSLYYSTKDDLKIHLNQTGSNQTIYIAYSSITMYLKQVQDLTIIKRYFESAKKVLTS